MNPTPTPGQPDRIALKDAASRARGRRRQHATRDTGRADRLLRSFAPPAEEPDLG